ncbi:MAG TPA: alpha/beta hydrolase [Stellaceae bacterium]|nr:alpha/beta hydrolase [Stellaceae bacterium]
MLAAELRILVRPTPHLDLAALAAELPRGDGHAVLALPAALRADGLTREFQSLLRRLGYLAHGWGLGLNLGPTRRLIDGCRSRLADLAAIHGPVSLVGFSMGGLFARFLALEYPGLVRRVITVASPFRAPLDSTALPRGFLARLWGGDRVDMLAATLAKPLRVPATALYSREDGVVAWEHCRDAGATADNVEYSGCHMTIVRNEGIMRTIADRLARPLA